MLVKFASGSGCRGVVGGDETGVLVDVEILSKKMESLEFSEMVDAGGV